MRRGLKILRSSHGTKNAWGCPIWRFSKLGVPRKTVKPMAFPDPKWPLDLGIHGENMRKSRNLGDRGAGKWLRRKHWSWWNPRKKPKILVLVLCFNVFIYKAPQSPKVSKSDPPILSYSNKTRCSKQLDTASCRTCQCWMSLERSPEPPRDEVQSCSAGSRGSLRRSTSKFPSGWQDGRMLFPDFWCQFMACQNCQNCKNEMCMEMVLDGTFNVHGICSWDLWHFCWWKMVKVTF